MKNELKVSRRQFSAGEAAPVPGLARTMSDRAGRRHRADGFVASRCKCGEIGQNGGKWEVTYRIYFKWQPKNQGADRVKNTCTSG